MRSKSRRNSRRSTRRNSRRSTRRRNTRRRNTRKRNTRRSRNRKRSSTRRNTRKRTRGKNKKGKMNMLEELEFGQIYYQKFVQWPTNDTIQYKGEYFDNYKECILIIEKKHGSPLDKGKKIQIISEHVALVHKEGIEWIKNKIDEGSDAIIVALKANL